MGEVITIRHSLVFLTLTILAVSKCISSTISIPELESQQQSFKGVVGDVKQEISTVEQLLTKYETKLSVAKVDLEQAKLRVDNKQRTLSDLESNYFESPSESLKRSIRQAAHGLELAIRGEKSKAKRVSRIEGKLIKSQNLSRMLKQERARIIAKIELLTKEIKVAKSERAEPSDSIVKVVDEKLAQNINETTISKLTFINNEPSLTEEVLPEIVAPPVSVNKQNPIVSSEAAKVLTNSSGEPVDLEKLNPNEKYSIAQDDEKDNVKLKKALKKLSQFRQWR